VVLGTKDGVEWDNSTCLLLLDLTPLCGDFARAFVNLEKGNNIPMKYYGISEAKEVDWQIGSFSQILIDSYLDGVLAPPSGTVIPEKNPPKEHMEAEPEPPCFKRLTFNKVTLIMKIKTFSFKHVFIFCLIPTLFSWALICLTILSVKPSQGRPFG